MLNMAKTIIKETQSVPTTTALTDEETRAILTPFAFKIDESLFGLSLAKPYKRALALLIDLLLIALLSDAPGELLSIVIAITLYRLGSKNKLQQAQHKATKRRAFLRVLGILIVFVTLVDVLPKGFSYFEQAPQHIVKSTKIAEDDGIKVTSMTSAIVLTALGYGIKSLTEDSQCTAYGCWAKELGDFFNKNLLDDDLSLTDQDIKKLISRAVLKTNLNEQEKKQLTAQLFTQYVANKVDQVTTNPITPNTEVKKRVKQTKKSANAISEYSLIAWFKGIINDLGLGFGWAAFYFTVLTSLWGGQTLGKKIVGIQVIQLDGTPLTLWDSFGRYGGYGAGIATGLLGFMQIFWDANRQAIHDKISATVVIDVKKNKKEKASDC
jgi:hypothetical protein